MITGGSRVITIDSDEDEIPFEKLFSQFNYQIVAIGSPARIYVKSLLGEDGVCCLVANTNMPLSYTP